MSRAKKYCLVLSLILVGHLVPVHLVNAAVSWSMEIEHNVIRVHMNEMISIPFTVNSSEILSDAGAYGNLTVSARTDETIAILEAKLIPQVDAALDTTHHGFFNITGVFLGSTKASIFINETEIRPVNVDFLEIVVIRQERLIDTIFAISVGVLVFVLYINFGCAIDWTVCRSTLARPTGLAAGFLSQLVFMPLLSYGIGQLLFPDRPDLRMGLFFTGISPSGGASNIWTVLLGGNLNLSVTMTILCTIAAFGTILFWTFTLGKHILDLGSIPVPYDRITTLVVALILPLGIGFFMQKKMPRLSKLAVRVMKPFSVFLIAFIVVFAILTNLYLFRLFSREIIIAGMALPWLGFLVGMLVAVLFRQTRPDVTAIAIETGIQNTGIAIFLSRFALQPPAADISTVVPVSVAIMTPVPLTILYLINLFLLRRRSRKSSTTVDEGVDSKFVDSVH